MAVVCLSGLRHKYVIVFMPETTKGAGRNRRTFQAWNFKPPALPEVTDRLAVSRQLSVAGFQD